jgi:hypothetical protein
MAGNAVEIRITASDGASQTFKSIGGSASAMGDSITGAANDSKKSIADLSSELTTVGTALVGVGAVMTGAVVGPMLAGAKAAFNQVSAVEQATFALSAYGGSAEDVSAALQDLTAYAEDASRSGGIFWSEDLYAAAQNLVVMGAELDNVSEYVQIMSRSVGLGASSWDELGVVIGRVISTGRLAGNEFDELSKAGYRLDESLRNTDISAEQLFDALDRGIPADSLLGQADTISGALIYLQGSLLNVGQAFLGVNDDMEFMAGGLGDQLVGSIGQAREVLLAMVPAAEAFGSAAAVAGGAASGLVDVVLMLPEPAQTAAIAMTGLTGSVTLAAGGLMLVVPRIAATVTALNALKAGLGTTAALATGWGAALAVGAVGGVVLGKAAYEVWESFRQGEPIVVRLHAALESLADQDFIGFFRQLAFGADETNAALEAVTGNAQDLWKTAAEQQVLGNTEVGTSLERLAANYVVVNDLAAERVESEWLLARANQEHVLAGKPLEMAENDLREAMTLTTAEMAVREEALNALGMAYLNPVTNADELNSKLASLDQQFYDGKITLDQHTDGLITLAREYGLMPDAIDGTTDAMERQSTGIDRLNAKRMSALEILGSLEEAERDNLAWQTERERTAYANQKIGPEARAEQEAAAVEALTGTLETLNEAQTRVNETYMEWLSNGGNILGFLMDFSMLSLEGSASWAEFANEFNAGLDTDQLNRSFDAVLNVFDQIDSLASRPAAALNIVETLFGEGGDPYDAIGPLRDLYDTGRIGQEQFNAAVLTGITIQSTYGEIQSTLNKIRVDQLPLLEAEYLAYQDQLRAISELGPVEQRRALALQDTAVQAQLATQYSTAYAASVGEIPEEVATNMIVSAAEADPVLADLLVQFGLVEEGADGELRVNFPDGDTVEQSITGLTNSIDALIITMGGVPPLRIEADTDEAMDNVVAFGDYLLDIDNVRASMGVDADTSDAEANIGGLVSTLDTLAGQSYEVEIRATVADAGGALGKAASGAAANIFGLPESVDIEVTATTTGGQEVQDLAAGVRELPDSASVAVSVDAQGFAEIGSLFDMIRALDEASATVNVAVVADTSDLDTALFAIRNTPPEAAFITVPILGDAGGQNGALTTIFNLDAAGHEVNVAITATSDGTEAVTTALQGVTAAADAIPESESVTVVALAEGATAALNGVTSAANGIPESESVSVTVFGASSAVSALNSVANAANNIPSSRSTTITTNRVTNNVQRYSSVGPRPFATGGTVWGNDAPPGMFDHIARAATGRTIMVGEAGPEMVTLPHGSQVTPHAASMSRGEASGGGVTINIGTINGGNRDEIKAVFAQEIVPMVTQAIREQERGMGVS